MKAKGDNEMNKLGRRLEKLENKINPPAPMKRISVIQKIGETLEQALERDGIKDLENTFLIVNKIVEHKALMENLHEQD